MGKASGRRKTLKRARSVEAESEVARSGGDNSLGNNDSPSEPETAAAKLFESMPDNLPAENLPLHTEERENRRSGSVICGARLSGQILGDCKTAYIQLLTELPFDEMERLTPGKFIEQLIAVGLNDYHSRQSESAIAHRIRLLIENKDAG